MADRIPAARLVTCPFCTTDYPATWPRCPACCPVCAGLGVVGSDTAATLELWPVDCAACGGDGRRRSP